MRELLKLGDLDLELLSGYEQLSAEVPLAFRDEGAVLRMLTGLAGDPRGVGIVRRMLIHVENSRVVPHIARDADVVELFARRVAEGRITIAVRFPRRPGGIAPGASGSATSTTSTAAAAAATTSPAPASEAATAAAAAAAAAAADDAQVDAAAQAEALTQAAEEGTPFCEECEKLKQQQAAAAQTTPPAAAAAAPPPPAVEAAQQQVEDARLEPAEQATALVQAAQNGTPFCAECEKLKQQQQAQVAAPPAAVAPPLPAPPPFDAAALDGPTQAAALTTAAKTGVPFCAECEKLKREREAAKQSSPAGSPA